MAQNNKKKRRNEINLPFVEPLIFLARTRSRYGSPMRNFISSSFTLFLPRIKTPKREFRQRKPLKSPLGIIVGARGRRRMMTVEEKKEELKGAAEGYRREK